MSETPKKIDWSKVLATAAWANLFALIWLSVLGIIEVTLWTLLLLVVLLGIAFLASTD